MVKSSVMWSISMDSDSSKVLVIGWPYFSKTPLTLSSILDSSRSRCIFFSSSAALSPPWDQATAHARSDSRTGRSSKNVNSFYRKKFRLIIWFYLLFKNLEMNLRNVKWVWFGKGRYHVRPGCHGDTGRAAEGRRPKYRVYHHRYRLPIYF